MLKGQLITVQEIFQKLNCGKERTYAVAKGYENGIDFLTQNKDKLSNDATIIASKIIGEFIPEAMASRFDKLIES